MNAYPIHSIDSAPEESKPLLEALKASVGMIPNLAAAMAASPRLLKAFLAVREIYSSGSFDPAEIQVLSLTAAYENNCSWCMAFHTMLAHKEGLSEQSIERLRAGQPPAEARLKALSDFARKMVRQRGAMEQADLEQFCAGGYTKEQAMEVILGMAFSLMANYAGHIADAPLNDPFKAYAWQRP